MEKKFNIWLIALAALAVVFAAGCDTSGGSTTPTDTGGHVLKEDPNGTGYVENSDGSWDIYTLEGLNAWAEYVTDESNSNYAMSATLVNCIEWEASGDYTSWRPIGDSTNAYTGTFDGGGHKVSNIAIGTVTSGDTYAGFFGYIDSNGSVEGLGLEIASFASADFAGGIAGYNYGGTISGCWSVGDVTANGDQASHAGGIVGQNSGTITACYSTGDVTASGGYSHRVGGIAGYRYYGNVFAACYWSDDSVAMAFGGTNAWNPSKSFKIDTTDDDSNWIAAETNMNEAIKDLEDAGTSVGWVYDGATANTPPKLKKSS